ncbi:Hypothetical_protein [Hexamita inflata]|uniref:Hypothetical_protein n=1 Tax=Hexamita inflata TaxID=28002 RepID=A0ABP1HDP8_9EUKA
MLVLVFLVKISGSYLCSCCQSKIIEYLLSLSFEVEYGSAQNTIHAQSYMILKYKVILRQIFSPKYSFGRLLLISQATVVHRQIPLFVNKEPAVHLHKPLSNVAPSVQTHQFPDLIAPNVHLHSSQFITAPGLHQQIPFNIQEYYGTQSQVLLIML